MVMRIALGSSRAAKIDAVRASISRIAEIAPEWNNAEILAFEVVTDAPLMPMSDKELMFGAKARAEAVCKLIKARDQLAELYIGLEGGFHSIDLDGKVYTFLRGWAYVTDGIHEGFGASPSISVPSNIVERVIKEKRELGEIIDEVAGQEDVRSRQGTWGVLSLDLLTRAMSFEMALIGALAPFYNKRLFIK
jgi:inosine/xanthosine triphosphatase